MKKLAILFVPLVLVLQMPLCPYRYLPQDWVNTYEYGKKWTHVLANLYLDSILSASENATAKASIDAKGRIVRVRLVTKPDQPHVEMQVRYLRFEIPRNEQLTQFRSGCESL